MKISYARVQAFLLSLMAMNSMLYFVPLFGTEGKYFVNIFIILAGFVLASSFLIYEVVINHRFGNLTFSKLHIVTVLLFFMTLYFMHIIELTKLPLLIKLIPFVVLLMVHNNYVLSRAYNYFRVMFAIIVFPSIILYFVQILGVPPFAGFDLPLHLGKLEAIKDDANGLLVPSEDSQEISQALLRLLRHSNDMKTFSAAAKATAVSHFGMESQLVKIENIVL